MRGGANGLLFAFVGSGGIQTGLLLTQYGSTSYDDHRLLCDLTELIMPKRLLQGVIAGAFFLTSALYAQDAATQGANVFTAQKCVLCHSVADKGNKKNPLDGVGKKLSAEDIKKWITTPKAMKADAKMKAYPNLPPKDLDALVAYLLTLK